MLKHRLVVVGAMLVGILAYVVMGYGDAFTLVVLGPIAFVAGYFVAKYAFPFF
jgi:general stress protein CsbA